MSEQFQGTPGPWEAKCFMVVATSFDRQSVYGGQEVCHTGHGRTDSEKAEANAKLIAAAPDLLDALQDAVHTIEALERHLSRYHPGTYCGANKARSAIAKALGEGK